MKLTEKEFDTLIEALEHLPHKNVGSSILTKLTAAMIFRDDEDARSKAKAEIAKKEAEEELEQKENKKMCGIITGKLYMMKDQIVEEQS